MDPLIQVTYGRDLIPGKHYVICILEDVYTPRMEFVRYSNDGFFVFNGSLGEIWYNPRYIKTIIPK